MTKPEANDPCHCGSGKLYSQCCQQRDILQSILNPPSASAPVPAPAPAVSAGDAAIQAALQHHQAGRMAEAEAIYRQILQTEPNHPEALHLLGVLAHQVGQNDAAIELISKAIGFAPGNPAFYLNLGVVLKQQGLLDKARICFQQVVALNPLSVDAYLNLGDVCQAQQEWDDAVASYSKALEAAPNNAEAHHNLGSALMAKGLLNEAGACYRQAIALAPDSAAAHNNLGQTLLHQGRQEEAIACYREALRLQPGFIAALVNLGNALYALGRIDEAIGHYRQALALQPDSVEAINNLGSMLQEQGQHHDAIDCYRQAIALKPDYADAHYNLGQVLHAEGLLDDAIASYYQALEIRPDYANAYYNLGNALQSQGHLPEAVANFKLALALRPDYVEALCNLGKAYHSQHRFEEAASCYEQALAFNPVYAEVYSNLGGTLKALNQLDDAILSYQRALALKPDLAEAHNHLGTVLHLQGDTAQAVSCYRQALACRPDYAEAFSNLLFTLNYADLYPPSQCFDEARLFGQNVTRQVSAPFSSWTCPPQPERLRVGLVSGDLRTHPVGYFLEGMLSATNRDRLEIIAYPTHFEQDALTSRLRQNLAGWKPLTGLNDEEASRLIHDDGIHLLLDLSGHTAHNRLPLFAWKPAPVQASWLGYFATTGLTEMDYLLADPHVVPVEAEAEAQFTEAIWRLPDSYLCFTPPNVPIDVAALSAGSTGQLTFGCFNNITKMNDHVVALWARVLQAVPGSRLFLKANLLDQATIDETIRQRFAAHGIAPERLLLEGHSPRAELLEAYHRVDIALDPFPYPGGTSSAESLWMGVPVITRKGDRFLSHVGESIAHSAGLSDWIARDDDDYVAKAVEKAGDLEQLAQLRAGLRQKVLASPLFDAARFARHFEAALWGMWQQHQERQ